MTRVLALLMVHLVVCHELPRAQERPSHGTVVLGGQSGSGVVFSGSGGGQVSVISMEPVDFGRPVLNAPYSADVITEVTQQLNDGNEVEQRVSASVARDSRGRVRREQQGIALGAVMVKRPWPIVTITDPGTGICVTLDLASKVALRSRVPSIPLPVPVGPQSTTAVMSGAFGVVDADPSHEVRTQALATKKIEGVRVEGTETTITIAAGAVGNKRPINVVHERWYSPELQVVVFSRRSDPRYGETRYRLTKIVRKEPPASLFEVPSDFRIEEAQPSAAGARPLSE